MTRRFFGICTALTALVSGSCIDDPLADLDGAASAIVTSHAGLQLTQGGDAFPVTVSVVDGRAMPLQTPITATPCDGAVSVVADTAYAPVPPTSARFIVAGVTPAASCLNLTGGGLTRQFETVVLPVSFSGAISDVTVGPWDTITVSATATLGFDPATSQVDFGAGNLGQVLTRTATSLQVVVPPTTVDQPAPLTIQNVDVTYVPGLRVNLPTSTTVTNVSQYGDPSGPGGAVITLPDTIYDGFANGVVDRFFTFTLAAPTTFTVVLEWASAADVDLLFCNAACSAFVGNFNGATGANPETSTVTLAAGTYNIYINNFTPGEPAPFFKFRATP